MSGSILDVKEYQMLRANILALILLSLTGLVFVASATPAVAMIRPPVNAMVDSGIRDALRRAGLDPQALAAAGVVPSQVAECVSAVANSPVAAPGFLAQIDATYETARSVHDSLERRVQSGLASESEVAQLVAAKQSLEAAASARQSVSDTLHFAGAAQLSPAQQAALTVIRSNRAWNLPIELLAVSRTEAEWVALRKALTNERVSAASGQTPNAACQALLGAARSNSAVAAAKSAIDTNLAAIQSAWSVAAGD